MEVGARPAMPADIPLLEELAATALSELLTNKGGSLFSRREARARPLEDLMADSSAIVAAGTIDDAVVGYAVATAELLRDGSRLAVISDLFVEDAAREVGVGEALIDELVRWARAAGCVGLDAVVLPGNRAAKNFFETFGLTARAIVVHRGLITAGDPDDLEDEVRA